MVRSSSKGRAVASLRLSVADCGTMGVYSGVVGVASTGAADLVVAPLVLEGR